MGKMGFETTGYAKGLANRLKKLAKPGFLKTGCFKTDRFHW